RRRHDQHVLLLQDLAGLPAFRRPDAFLSRLLADFGAVVGVFVRPDVAPDVEVAEFGMTGECQRRQLRAFTDLRRPAVDLARYRAGLQRVEADLVNAAKLARFELWRERRRDEDLALLVRDEFARVGWPARELCRLLADAGARRQILVRPDMDDLIER